MRLPPLLEERSPAVEFVLVVLGPIALGAVAGLVLCSSKSAYLIVSLIAALGGIGAGLEHRGALRGAYRGLTGGLIYGVATLVAFELRDHAAKVHLPHHHSLLVVITAGAGVVLGALGGALRARRDRRPQA